MLLLLTGKLIFLLKKIDMGFRAVIAQRTDSPSDNALTISYLEFSGES